MPKAIADAQQAMPGEVFVQANGYWIVRGPKSREHIFKPNGRVDTSLNRSRNRHRELLRQGERREVTEVEFEQFKELIR